MTSPGPQAAYDLVTVRLLGFPLDVYQRSSEAFEGLRRELALVALRTPGAADIPHRLLELVDALVERFGGFAAESDRARDRAIERGLTSLPELTLTVPEAAAEACLALSGMLDEADEFCRQGDVLLSLATSDEGVAFRRWYLGEVVAQVRGHPPLAWPEADRAALLADPRMRGA